MVRLCRIAGLEDQQRLRHRREQPSSPHLGPQPPAPRRTTRQPSRNGGGGNGSSPSHGGSSRSSSATRRSATALLSSETAATAAVRTAARPLSFSEGSRVGSMAPAAESPPPAAGPGTEGVPSATPRGRRANGVSPDDTPPDRDGVLFLNGLDDRGGGVRRSMSEEGPGAGAGFRPPPVLARRCTGESVGRQAAAVAAAAAMAAAASSESPRGGTRKRWQRALRKLRLRPRCVYSVLSSAVYRVSFSMAKLMLLRCCAEEKCAASLSYRVTVAMVPSSSLCNWLWRGLPWLFARPYNWERGGNIRPCLYPKRCGSTKLSS